MSYMLEILCYQVSCIGIVGATVLRDVLLGRQVACSGLGGVLENSNVEGP